MRDRSSALPRRESAAVLVIDVQEKLIAAMPEAAASSVKRNISALASGAKTMGVPVLASEQYPRGLGPTVAGLLPEGTSRTEKLEFSCADNPALLQKLGEGGRRQVVLTGMEAHICVLQTAVGLLQRDYEVFVAEDAICSRQEPHKESAVRNLERAGCTVLPTEAILFAWLGRAGTPEFKEVSQLVK